LARTQCPLWEEQKGSSTEKKVTNNKERSRNILCTLLATILEDEEITAQKRVMRSLMTNWKRAATDFL
jgi:hypothetical protein